MALTDGLALSVVMPVRDGAELLPRSLSALRASDLPADSWELIVVDDGSRDGSGEIAAQYAELVLRIPPPGCGAPSARNRGALRARAPVIVFVDADVSVHPDALRRVRDTLAERPEVSAVFGAYDLTPAAPELVSQYRNLLHSYVHRRDEGRAVTFWTGLGAIRGEALQALGGFDEGERLDDVELGYRLSAAGRQIVLDPAIAGTHLKRWTLWNLVTTDLFSRGVPWVRLLLAGRRPRGRPTLNVRRLDQVLTGLAAALALFTGVGVLTGQARWLAGAAGVALVMVLVDWRLFRWFWSLRGWRFAAAAVPLRLLYFMVNITAVVLASLPVSWRRPPIGPPETPMDTLRPLAGVEVDREPAPDEVPRPVMPQPSGSL